MSETKQRLIDSSAPVNVLKQQVWIPPGPIWMDLQHLLMFSTSSINAARRPSPCFLACRLVPPPSSAMFFHNPSRTSPGRSASCRSGPRFCGPGVSYEFANIPTLRLKCDLSYRHVKRSRVTMVMRQILIGLALKARNDQPFGPARRCAVHAFLSERRGRKGGGGEEGEER